MWLLRRSELGSWCFCGKCFTDRAISQAQNSRFETVMDSTAQVEFPRLINTHKKGLSKKSHSHQEVSFLPQAVPSLRQSPRHGQTCSQAAGPQIQSSRLVGSLSGPLSSTHLLPLTLDPGPLGGTALAFGAAPLVSAPTSEHALPAQHFPETSQVKHSNYSCAELSGFGRGLPRGSGEPYK